MDSMTWLVVKGQEAQLAPLVQFPKEFIAHREQTLFAQTDATAVWIKLRGEDSRVIPEAVLGKLARLRRSKSKLRQAAGSLAPEERQLLEDALQSSMEEAQDLKAQVDQQFSQGGDKHRLTFLITGVTKNWFARGKKPEGYLEPIKILYKCAHPVRLEDITDTGTWARDHQYYDSFGTLITRKQGESARGLLGWWVKWRAKNRDHEFFKYYRVWGQPSAWQDQVITTWLVQDLASSFQEKFGTTQCVHQWDCLGAQWSEPVLHESWLHNHILQPVMPDATAYLQSPDTHWNFPYKADIKESKAELQHECEIAAQKLGQPFQSNWGLFELAEARQAQTEKRERGEDRERGALAFPAFPS